jgi:hypothetical protein
MIRFLCPTCGKRLKAGEDFLGKAVKCQQCGQGLVVRSLDGLDLDDPFEVTPRGPASRNGHAHDAGVHHTAQLIKKRVNGFTFACHGKRGILSYFLFRVLPSDFLLLLRSVSFPDGIKSPFADVEAEDVKGLTVFSELSFGRQGFGDADGAVYFELKGQPYLVFLDVDIGETYRRSCRGTSYEFTLQGRLELRWRLLSLFKGGHIKEHDGIPYVQETEPVRRFYAAADPFYHPRADADDPSVAAYRHMALVPGLRQLFEDYISRCAPERIFFVLSTGDKENPFGDLSLPQGLLPRCYGRTWDEIKPQFAWVSNDFIEGCRSV